MIRTETIEPKPNGIAARAMAARNNSGVPINIIRMDGGTQSRAMLQDGVIEEYADVIKSGIEFPPIVIFYDGSDHWLADGFHRIRAFIAAGRDTIPSDVRQGTRRDAILYSVGANETHGLRRTNEDKRRAVLTLLNDAEWCKWSDGEIAKRCAVSREYVNRLRPTVTCDQVTSERTYVTKHGTTATMSTSAIGKSAPKDDNMNIEEIEPEEAKIDKKRISLPEGASLDQIARDGMEREAGGETSEAVAKSYGIGVMSYRAACDVVFLFDRGGYSPVDAEIVERAYHMAVDERKIPEARELIDPVAVKVWGAGNLKARPRPTREPARVEQFEHAFGIVMHTCTTAAELDLPYIHPDEIKSRVKEIKHARRHLLVLLTRIEELHND